MLAAHVGAFIEILRQTAHDEIKFLNKFQGLALPHPMFVDEVTFGHLACKAFVEQTKSATVFREQWVGARKTESGTNLPGKRVDVVIGEPGCARHWIEMKIWKPGKSKLFNHREILKDVAKLSCRVAAGDKQEQTYHNDVWVVVPSDFTRHVVVLRAERGPISTDDWTISTPETVHRPLAVTSDVEGAWHLYMAVYEV